MKLDHVIAVRPTKTVYLDGDKVIKLFNETHSAADVLNEAHNHARVLETGVKVPNLIEVIKIDGKWAIVLEYIKGKTMAQLMAENPEKSGEYLSRFVDIQLDMQSRKAPRLTRLAEKMKNKIKESGLDATARYELSMRLNGIHEHKKLCHGDFNPSNVIIDDKDEAYIIDWSHATQGNASGDAARTFLLFCLAGNEKMAESYMKLFCKKSNTARQYVDKWLSVVAASQLVKGKPEERDLLLRWVNVVEYE